MTARVIAADYHEYGEHVAKVAGVLSTWSSVATEGLSSLDRDDVRQIMCERAFRDLDKVQMGTKGLESVHGQACRYPSIPEGGAACCGLMATSLVRGAIDVLRTEWDRKRLTINLGSREEVLEATGSCADDPPEVALLEALSTISAISQLPRKQLEVAMLYGLGEGRTLQEVSTMIGVSTSTVQRRFESALRLLGAMED